MRDSNVLNFPSSEARCFDSDILNSSYNEQLELFSGDYNKLNAIVFINLESTSQDILLASLAKNSIKTIIDLRRKPVFPKPRFNHKFIMHYFYQRSVNYIECAMCNLTTLEPHGVLHQEGEDPLERWISRGISVGLTACIVDDAAIESGTVANFRYCVTRRILDVIEIHPRSLI